MWPLQGNWTEKARTGLNMAPEIDPPVAERQTERHGEGERERGGGSESERIIRMWILE